ncbi:AAA family ATPase [Clostridium sp. 19966]|uniref:HelD family protein n=1 Tax=Clostridium sp. 19966 TaxID=2768166 RepID=UPI0028DD5F41|nr:UvrD-helicase domain-containing protein [Clostridium sp. 19966]MDT8719265.1 AAA family ATPase [Clostridium sp. 19966]
MDDFKSNYEEEDIYLGKTLNIIKNNVNKEEDAINPKLSKLLKSARDMWEEGAHSSYEFEKIPEMNQYLQELKSHERDYGSTIKKIDRYNRMLKSPYFGRFDFIERGELEAEKIYVGLYNLMDDTENDIYVYDWRAPLCSIFYRNELGKANYRSPIGVIEGEVSLKRQYKIEDSKLKYFFDSSITINDEMLQEVLSRNSSPKMKSIVETIQKEQDIAIRDTENELLIVQGAAGSGKTSIALHRIAFLLYEGLKSKLNINNIVVISPNSLFSEYISDVLPELGEENVKQLTIDNFIENEKRQQQMESIISLQGKKEFFIRLESIKFKSSEEFVIILDRFIEYWERKINPFRDIYYNGKIAIKADEIKNMFLNNKINMPAAKRLKRIENIILEKIHSMRKARLDTIEKVVTAVTEDHILEIKSFSRLLAVKEANRLMKYIKGFTEIEELNLYKGLFNDRTLFYRLAKGLELPASIEEIINYTKEKLNRHVIFHEDELSMLCMKLKLRGNDEFGEIRQVVIDEAQDYYPIHYHIFNLLFKNARYTVVGDINQTLEKPGNEEIYEYINHIFNKKKSVKLTLNKSYRSSYEISSFNQKLIGKTDDSISFDRHEAYPQVKAADNLQMLNENICMDINKFFQKGYKSIAIITKSQQEAENVKQQLQESINVVTLNDKSYKNIRGSAVVIPAYLAKGLEFDAVIIYEVSKEKYKSDFDKRLLYIGCTRALHQLVLYYVGDKSNFI